MRYFESESLRALVCKLSSVGKDSLSVREVRGEVEIVGRERES